MTADTPRTDAHGGLMARLDAIDEVYSEDSLPGLIHPYVSPLVAVARAAERRRLAFTKTEHAQANADEFEALAALWATIGKD